MISANTTVLLRTCPAPSRLLLLEPKEQEFASRWRRVGTPGDDTEVTFRHYAGSLRSPHLLFTVLLLRNSCGSYGYLLSRAREIWTDLNSPVDQKLQPCRCLVLPWPTNQASDQISEAQLLCYCMRRFIYFDLGLDTLNSAEEMKLVERLGETEALVWVDAALRLLDLGLFYLPKEKHERGSHE